MEPFGTESKARPAKQHAGPVLGPFGSVSDRFQKGPVQTESLFGPILGPDPFGSVWNRISVALMCFSILARVFPDRLLQPSHLAPLAH